MAIKKREVVICNGCDKPIEHCKHVVVGHVELHYTNNCAPAKTLAVDGAYHRDCLIKALDG